MKPEEQGTLTDYWNDLQKGDLEPETYIRVGNELAIHAASLEALNAELVEALEIIVAEEENGFHRDADCPARSCGIALAQRLLANEQAKT